MARRHHAPAAAARNGRPTAPPRVVGRIPLMSDDPVYAAFEAEFRKLLARYFPDCRDAALTLIPDDGEHTRCAVLTLVGDCPFSVKAERDGTCMKCGGCDCEDD